MQARRAALALFLAALLTTTSRATEVTEIHFDGMGGGAAAADWEGVIAGSRETTDFVDDGAGTLTWTAIGRLESTPRLPVPRVSAPRGRGMYDIIQFIVDWVLGYSSVHPTELQDLTSYTFESMLTFQNLDVGLTIQTFGNSTLVDGVPRFEGSFAGALESPMAHALQVYAETGTVTPAGPGAAWLEGTGIVSLTDGDELPVTVTGWYFFDAALELENAYAYEYGGFYEVTSDDPLRWDVHTTYSERDATVHVPQAGGGVLALEAFPNPFRTDTALRFDHPASGRVRVDVFDVSGRHVTNLVNGSVAAGPISLRWDGARTSGEPVGAGVYYVRLGGSGTTAVETVVRR